MEIKIEENRIRISYSESEISSDISDFPNHVINYFDDKGYELKANREAMIPLTPETGETRYYIIFEK